LRLVPGGIDVVGPDVTEDESPDADEDIDEDLHGSGGRENPTRLIFDALGCVLGENERLGDATARNRRTVGLHRKAYPGTRDQGLTPQERLRQERQDQNFYDREDNDER